MRPLSWLTIQGSSTTSAAMLDAASGPIDGIATQRLKATTSVPAGAGCSLRRNVYGAPEAVPVTQATPDRLELTSSATPVSLPQMLSARLGKDRQEVPPGVLGLMPRRCQTVPGRVTTNTEPSSPTAIRHPPSPSTPCQLAPFQ